MEKSHSLGYGRLNFHAPNIYGFGGEHVTSLYATQEPVRQTTFFFPLFIPHFIPVPSLNVDTCHFATVL